MNRLPHDRSSARRSKRRIWVPLLIGATFVGALAFGLGSKLSTLRTPPGGTYAGMAGPSRVYFVQGTDEATWRSLKAWGAEWGVPDGPTSRSGYGGRLSTVTISGSGSLRVGSQSMYPVPKGCLRVVVTDRPMTFANLALRIKSLLP